MSTVFFHELKQGLKTLLIWGIAVAALIMLCMVIFPDMQSQSEGIDEMFATMGGFTDAFGMDTLSIADPLGFYGIEGGAILGLGGAFFAALLGSRMLSKEENEHTAEFLLTHPVSRPTVITGKLCALFVQVLLFNAICIGCGYASFALINESFNADAFLLFHLAQLVMHLEVAAVCFGVSAFLKRGSVGFGLGLAALLYFCNIFANLSEDFEFIRFITPFGYADAAQVIPDVAIDMQVMGVGCLYLVIGVVVAYVVYSRKDIAS